MSIHPKVLGDQNPSTHQLLTKRQWGLMSTTAAIGIGFLLIGLTAATAGLFWAGLTILTLMGLAMGGAKIRHHLQKVARLSPEEIPLGPLSSAPEILTALDDKFAAQLRDHE